MSALSMLREVRMLARDNKYNALGCLVVEVLGSPEKRREKPPIKPAEGPEDYPRFKREYQNYMKEQAELPPASTLVAIKCMYPEACRCLTDQAPAG
jgi:hypothetical protein